MTPGRFVERVRVEAARRLLEQTSRGVPDVAAACGFGSPETMRIAFRRTLGVSPKRYRSRLSTAVASGRRLAMSIACNEVGPVLGGAVVWPLDQARQVLRFYDELAHRRPVGPGGLGVSER